VTTRLITPVTFGLPAHPLASVRGGTPAENAAVLQSLLDNQLELDSPIETFVVMNAAALIYVSGLAATPVQGVEMARTSVSSGSAKKAMETFRDLAKAEIAAPT